MKYRLSAILVGLLAGALLWRVTSRRPVVAARVVPRHTASAPIKTPPAPISSSKPEEPAGTPEPPAASAQVEIVAGADPGHPTELAIREASSGPEAAGLAPAIVMENMRRVFRQYSSRYGGNPVGTNPEITAALNGKNPRQVVFLNPEDGMRINDRGELIDNWGTPFFFHQLSATEMEIHSAGPDRKMWTPDDLVIR